MSLEKFITHFAEQFDDTPIDRFTGATVFKNLGEWDSLTALSVIAMIDEEYEKNVTGSDIRDCETISELYERVIK